MDSDHHRQQMPSTVVDYSGLIGEVTVDEVQAFMHEHGMLDSTPAQVMGSMSKKSRLTGIIITAILLSLAAIGFHYYYMFTDDLLSMWLTPVLLIPVSVVIIIVLLRSQTPEVYAARLARFAKANGWVYETRRGSRAPQPGMIFQAGQRRSTRNVVAGSRGLSFEIGTHSYEIGGAVDLDISRHWTYLCIDVQRNLPHMVLDARANNVSLLKSSLKKSLPMPLKQGQVLPLEGDFNKHFTLYAPKEYERDALYVFTPDLMALLIDNTAQFDVEVIDSKIYFYHKDGSFDTTRSLRNITNPLFTQRLLSIIEVVGTKFDTQTHRYTDSRVDSIAGQVVAPGGYRLKQGLPLWAKIVIWVGVLCLLIGVLSCLSLTL